MKEFINRNSEKLLILNLILVVILMFVVAVLVVRPAFAAPKMYTPNFTSVKVTDYNKMKLSYKTRGSYVTGVQIYNYTTKKYIKTTSKSSYVYSNLSYNNTHKFKVRAYYKKGGKTFYSRWSSSRSAKQVLPTVSIKNLYYTTKGVAIINFGATMADNLEVYNVTTGKKYKTSTVNTKFYSVSNLTYGKNYTFKIRQYEYANGKTYYSNWSSSKSAKYIVDTPKFSSISSSSRYALLKVSRTYMSRPVSGIQIYNITTSSTKNINIDMFDKSSIYKLGKYTKRKTYKFKVRYYYTYSGGTKYSSWSSIKSVKIR